MESGRNATGSELIRALNTPLYGARGWIRLLAVLLIANGVLMALSLMGLLIAWLPVWLGVLLWQTARAVDAAQRSGDRSWFLLAQSKLKTYFVVSGVLALILLLVTALGMGGMGVAMLLHGGGMGVFAPGGP